MALLAALPVQAAVSRVLGFVQTTQSSYIDGFPAAIGTNVLPGDVLTTNADGSFVLRLGRDLIYILGSSSVRLENANNGILATLTSGSVEFLSPNGTGVTIDAADVLVSAKTSQPTRAQITLLAKHELKVASVGGPLELELDGRTYTLTPGQTYGVRIVGTAASAHGQFTTVQSARRKRSLVIFLLATTAAVAGLTYLAKELHESPDVP